VVAVAVILLILAGMQAKTAGTPFLLKTGTSKIFGKKALNVDCVGIFSRAFTFCLSMLAPVLAIHNSSLEASSDLRQGVMKCTCKRLHLWKGLLLPNVHFVCVVVSLIVAVCPIDDQLIPEYHGCPRGMMFYIVLSVNENHSRRLRYACFVVLEETGEAAFYYRRTTDPKTNQVKLFPLPAGEEWPVTDSGLSTFTKYMAVHVELCNQN
jgi:hypothetical protein